MEEIIHNQEETYGKRLLLHACCAPCSSYVLKYLSSIFRITILFYNPNITDIEEYQKRVEEEKRFIREFSDKENPDFPISFLEAAYETTDFFNAVKGFEKEKEGGERCFRCYELRLRETARIAKENNFDYFCSTLSISPLKNAVRINEIGNDLEQVYGVSFLPSDFKKKNGYKQSIELSKEYGLYRQDYCGCAFSLAERIQFEKNKKVSQEV